MWKDPIVEEVRAARIAYAKKFDFDLEKIVKDLQKQAKKRQKAAGSDTAPAKTKRTRPGRRAA